MFNSAKCSFARELGRPFPSGFYEAIAEDALTDSLLIPKPLSLPAATKTTFFMATSPDGKLIASAHGDHCVYVCDILQGKVIHRLAGHPRSPWALAFHPSRSDLLASGCLGGEVRVWDLKTGCSESLYLDNEDAVVPGTSSGAEASSATVYTTSVAIASVAFHPDERLLAIAAGDRLIFWDWSCKYPRGECRTATPRERVRYVKFDRTGILYTGITNSRQVITTTVSSSGADVEPARPAMASTPPEVMPHRCRELLTSRNEILQMRAELSRRHEQLLQRYNDLLRRYQELRERYPDIQPSNPSNPQSSRPTLPPPPSPPPPAPRRWLDEADGGQRFISLMEENRRVGLEEARANLRQSQTERDQFEASSSSRPETPMSPIQLERLDEPESYAREMASSSLQRFERRHNLSYDRLCRSYRSMSESAQRLVMEFQRVYGEYVTMKEEVRRRTGTLEPSRGAQYETGRAVLSTLAQMQVIMLSGDIPPSGDLPAEPAVETREQQQAWRRGDEARGWQWSEERRMYERVQREARTLMRVHDLLLELRNRLDFQADVVDDLRRGRDRLERLIVELSQTAPGGSLEALHQRLVTEIRHFKLFIRQWKQVVMSNLTTSGSAASSSGRTSEENSASTSSFVRLSLSPEARNQPSDSDGPSTSEANQEATSSSASGSSTVSKRVANILVSPLRKRPSAGDGGNPSTGDRRSVEPMTSIRLPLPPPVVNLSPSRTVETPGPSGGTTYHYSYPYSPPHRYEDRQQGANAGADGAGSSYSQSSDHAVPIKRRRLNFGQAGESSTSATASSGAPNSSEASSSDAAQDLNRTQPLPNFSHMATNSSATGSTSSNEGGQAALSSLAPALQRRDRPNIVLYVPRESSRMASFAAATNSGGPQNQQERSASSSLSELSARVNARRYVVVGSPPRFERVTPNPGYSYRGLTSSLLRQSGQEPPFSAIRDRGNGARGQPNQGNGANGGDSNNNDDEWEYSYDLNRAVNRAIAGAFIGAGDMALANNILDMTCRIQRWATNIETGKYPDLAQSESNVVVSKCKLHNDGSVSINESGTLLAAFVENSAPDRSLWAHTTLKIVSLRPEDRGTVLYEKTFGPNAISVSFSPADGRHILIGLASRRYLRLRHSPQTCAMVFSLRGLHENRFKSGGRRNPGELKLAMNVEHDQRPSGTLFGGGVVGHADDGSNLLTWGFRVDSVNCATWLPAPGQGLCYGTNRGQIFLLTPKREETDETDASDKSLLMNPGRPAAPFQRQLARWNMFEDNQQAGAGEAELLSGNGNLIV